MNKWDKRFIELAEFVSRWSKDPSTQTGAVIARQNNTVASLGYNGFPRDCDDDAALYADRPIKYARIIHCEMNAILAATESVRGYTLYTFPFLTCDRCAAHVIQAGIIRVVAPKCPDHLLERWEDTFKRARKLYDEASVVVDEL